jgi:uncharacterized protein (DUF736 family)
LIIGILSRTSDGWAGTIRTISGQTKARFIPNDKRDSDRAPDFRLMAGHCELGVAWRKRTQAEAKREFLSVSLDSPFLIAPMSAALFESSHEGDANLVWKRQDVGVSQEE